MGSERNSGKAVVVNLNVGRAIAEIEIPGLPHPGSGITWSYQGRPVRATPHLDEGIVSVIDVTTWRVIGTIPTAGPGFFLRRHENTPWAWVDTQPRPGSRHRRALARNRQDAPPRARHGGGPRRVHP